MCGALLVAGTLVTSHAQARVPLVSARCQAEPGPGRVRCEVEVEVREGELSWADTIVRRAPAHARPLRSRVGPDEALTRTDRRLRLPLSLVATENGRGELQLVVRAVHCRQAKGGRSCRTHVRRLSTTVQVGPVVE